MEAISTALWITVAVNASSAMGAPYAWALSFIVIKMMFGSNCSMNGLCDVMDVLKGEKNWFNAALTFIFQAIGAIGAKSIAGDGFGFKTDGAEAAAAFTGDGGLWSKEFYKYFFCNSEVVALFIFCIFLNRGQGWGGMSDTVMKFFLIATAFMVGGGSFLFFPARYFNSFGAFATAGAWATLIQQVWAV